MSHVVTVKTSITDLDALAEAARLRGLVFSPNQQTYRWWGKHVGDYPLPIGFSVEDLGRCEHAISVPHNPQAWEIGVVARRDGLPGWTLIHDFYGHRGRALEALAGPGCRSLVHEYAAVCAKRRAALLGQAVKEQRNPDGSIAKLTILAVGA